MEMTKQDRLTKLLNAYSHHYDIERDVDVEGGHFPATAFYYLRDENYLISKKHVLSAIENYEYIYIDLADHLTAEDLQRKIDLSRQAGMSHIKPNKEHMSSFVRACGSGPTPSIQRPGTHQENSLPQKLPTGTPWLDGVSHRRNGNCNQQLPFQSGR